MKKIIALVLVAFLCFSFAACGCKHEWTEATCLNPKICNLCGITEGESIEHSYMDANCDNPKRCSLCDDTEGEALGHNYVDGYCTRCYAKDPHFFDAENYGFINSYNMYTWVEVTSYSIGKENANATFTEHGYSHSIYKFKDRTFYSYSRYETDLDGEVNNKNLTEKLKYTSNYTIINNDSVSMDGDTWTIFERKFDNYGNLILKVKIGSEEKWFLLEEQIDWEESPKVEDYKGIAWKQYTYYFK